jgi:uncharacterized membrane protein YbhN (UPF0104 family)
MGAEHRGWRRAATALFSLLLVAFLAYYLRGVDWRSLTALHLSPGYLLLALPVSVAPRLLRPLAWATLIRGCGARPPAYPQIALVYAKGWLGRYIPGKVAAIGGMVLFGSAYGIRKGVLAVTSVVEAGLQIVTALALCFVLFTAAGETQRLGSGVRGFSLVAFALMVLVLAPPVFNRLIARGHRLLGRPAPPEEDHLTSRSYLKAVLWYLAVHAVGAVPLFLILKAAWQPLTVSDIPYVTATFLLAGALGTLAVFAPSGIGVREGVLLILLGALLPRAVAALVVVFLRVWSIGVDFVFYFVAVGLDRAYPAEPAVAGHGRVAPSVDS